MSKKVDIRRVRTKRILGSTLMTLLKKKDLHDIKIKELTEKANVSRQTFYRHYEMIEELFKDCVEDLFEQYDAKFKATIENESFSSAIESKILLSFQLFYEFREPMEIILSVNDKDLIIDNLQKQLEKFYELEGVIKRNPPNIDSVQHMSIRYEAGGLYVVLIEWLTKQNHLLPKDLANIYTVTRKTPFYQHEWTNR